MTGFVLRRLAASVPVLLGIATLVFVVVHLAPGDPSVLLLSPGLTAEAAQQMRTNLGLDDPIVLRYLKWLGALASGDFGYSVLHGRPVSEVLRATLPNTFVLGMTSLVFAFGVGVGVGALQAVRRRSRLDVLAGGIMLFFYSMPTFWLAIMLVMGLSVLPQSALGLPISFPASGMTVVDYETLSLSARLLDRISHLVLPTLALGLVLAAGISRYARGSLLEVLGEDYVRTARAKGVSERGVVLRHALRTGLLPIVTLAGLYVPMLLSGAVFVEVVFAWPGTGRVLFDAVFARDYPLVMACTVLFSVVVVLANLAADVVYGWVDPRVRHV